MINPMDLTGKKVLISGGGGGIGRTTAMRLAELGAKVVLCGVYENKLQETIQSMPESVEDVDYYSIDFKKIDTIEKKIKQIYTEVGTLDGFVHCAGISPMRPLKMTTYESVLPTMQINFFSFVEICRCLMHKKRFSDGGSIVAMSSTASIHGKPTKVGYSASKGALDAAIRCMICDLQKRRIRINSVMPSWVNTDMYKSFLKDYPYSRDIQEIEERQYMGVVEPEEVANVIAFLLSDAAKTITGTSILMDGGILQG